MDWLTRLPWIGPRVAAAMRTHAWRAYAHLQTVHWNRLAATITFTSFLAMFPLLALVAAVGAALLPKGRLDSLEHKISQQIPGIADQLDIGGLVANAGTVGGIAAAALVFTGIGWVGSVRECLRAVWGKDKEERNAVVSKLLDGGILLGLGAAVLVSLAASAFATAAVNWTADRAGISDQGPGPALLTLVGYVLAVVANFLILTYLLTLLPGVEPPRRAVVVAALVGAVGFEALKVLISGYLRGVAGKSMYGAFGTPVALLLWINFIAKLLLYCAAWTAVPLHAPTAGDTADGIPPIQATRPEGEAEDGAKGGAKDTARGGDAEDRGRGGGKRGTTGATRAPDPARPAADPGPAGAAGPAEPDKAAGPDKAGRADGADTARSGPTAGEAVSPGVAAPRGRRAGGGRRWRLPGRRRGRTGAGGGAGRR